MRDTIVQYTGEKPTETKFQIETSKTVWWYICMALGTIGFVKTALSLAETKTLVKLGKVVDVDILG